MGMHSVRTGSIRGALLGVALVLHGCGGERREAARGVAAAPHDAFWSAIQQLCGNAYGGTVAASTPPDTVMSRSSLMMHVRECSTDTIRIPFHVGENRSRTWILTRTEAGLRLKHDHRHEDGTEDSVTQYGGDTRDSGTGAHQEFFADSFTASLIPAARTNVWTIEIVSGERFAYALRREGTERRFRAEFDLSRPIAAPPPPWGSRPR